MTLRSRGPIARILRIPLRTSGKTVWFQGLGSRIVFVHRHLNTCNLQTKHNAVQEAIRNEDVPGKETVRHPDSSVMMFCPSHVTGALSELVSCHKTAWIMRLHETCKVRHVSCLSQAMSVSRAVLGFAILSWTFWIAADLFVSGFPASRPSRLCREHVRQLSCRRRVVVPGFKSGASTKKRDVPMDSRTVVAASASTLFSCAVKSDGQLVCFGGNTW